jgi:ATP-binding cassette subfamily F protein uup
LDRGELLMAQANYSAYLELKEKMLAEKEAQHLKRQNFLRKETEWIRAGVQARTTKSRARIERYEALKAMAAPERMGKVELNFDSARLGGKTIEALKISKTMGEQVLFEDFSYLVEREDRLGIIGINGCGKSTLMQLMAGVLKPDSGFVDQGETVRVGYLSQETHMDDLSIRVIDYLQSDRIETKEETLSASQMLERFLFPKNLHYLTLAHISGGERRRLGLLKVLMEQPNILFLDEPTLGLDVIAKHDLWDAIRSLKGKVTIILTTHYMEEAEALSDRIGIMKSGRLLAVGTAEELKHKVGANDFETAFVSIVKEGTV